MPRPQLLRDGSFEDALDGCIERGIELGIALLGRQPFDQRPREARHHAVILAQPLVCFFPRIPPEAQPPVQLWDVGRNRRRSRAAPEGELSMTR